MRTKHEWELYFRNELSKVFTNLAVIRLAETFANEVENDRPKDDGK